MARLPKVAPNGWVPLEERRQQEALDNLGTDFKQWRMIRGMTRKQLADKSNVSESSIARLERGDPGVSIGTMVRLARVLKIPDFLDMASPFESEEGQRLISAFKGKDGRGL